MTVSAVLRNPRLVLPDDPVFNQKIQDLFSKAGLVYQPPVDPEAPGSLTDPQGEIPTMDVVHMTPADARENLKNYRAELAVIHEHEITSSDDLSQRVALPHSLSAKFTVTATRIFSHSLKRIRDLDQTIIGTTYPEFLKVALKREGLDARVIAVPRENLVETLTSGGFLDAAFDHAENILTAPCGTPTNFIPNVLLKDEALNSRAVLATPRAETHVGIGLPLSVSLIARLAEVLPDAELDTNLKRTDTKAARCMAISEEAKTHPPLVAKNNSTGTKGWRLPSFLRT